MRARAVRASDPELRERSRVCHIHPYFITQIFIELSRPEWRAGDAHFDGVVAGLFTRVLDMLYHAHIN